MESDGVEWAILLHADDQICERWPLVSGNLVEELPQECGMVCCENIYSDFKTERDVAGSVDSKPHDIMHFPGNLDSIDRLGRDWFWPVTGSVIKISAYKSVGGFHPDVKYAGDNDLIVRFFLGGNSVCFTKQPFIFKRNHRGSVTSGQIRSGDYAYGWSHLMHRYLWLSSPTERVYNFLRQMFIAMRLMASSIKSRDWKCARGQVRAIWIFARSCSSLITGLPWLNPKLVRLQLDRRFSYQDHFPGT
jgi:hypothetical protein